MTVPAHHTEIRYRTTSPQGEWVYIERHFSPDEKLVNLPELVPGIEYDIDARAVSAWGKASVWARQRHVLGDSPEGAAIRAWRSMTGGNGITQ